MDKRAAWITALGLRVLGYLSMAVGVAARPLDGALIVVGAGAIVEGLLIEIEA